MRKSSIPNIFTFINLSFGILSLLATFKSEYLLAANYAKKTLKYINILWGRKVNLSSKGKDGSDILFMCDE